MVLVNALLKVRKIALPGIILAFCLLYPAARQDAQTRRPPRGVTSLTDVIYSAQFSPDSRTVVIARGAESPNQTNRDFIGRRAVRPGRRPEHRVDHGDGVVGAADSHDGLAVAVLVRCVDLQPHVPGNAGERERPTHAILPSGTTSVRCDRSFSVTEDEMVGPV